GPHGSGRTVPEPVGDGAELQLATGPELALRPARLRLPVADLVSLATVAGGARPVQRLSGRRAAGLFRSADLLGAPLLGLAVGSPDRHGPGQPPCPAGRVG